MARRMLFVTAPMAGVHATTPIGQAFMTLLRRLIVAIAGRMAAATPRSRGRETLAMWVVRGPLYPVRAIPDLPAFGRTVGPLPALNSHRRPDPARQGAVHDPPPPRRVPWIMVSTCGRLMAATPAM